MPYVERRTADGKTEKYYTSRTNAKRKPAAVTTGKNISETAKKLQRLVNENFQADIKVKFGYKN